MRAVRDIANGFCWHRNGKANLQKEDTDVNRQTLSFNKTG